MSALGDPEIEPVFKPKLCRPIKWKNIEAISRVELAPKRSPILDDISEALNVVFFTMVGLLLIVM